MKPELHGAPDPGCPPIRTAGRRRFLSVVGGLLLLYSLAAYVVLPLAWRTETRRHPDLAGSRSRYIRWTSFIGNWRGRMEVAIRGTRMAAWQSRCCARTRNRQPPRRTAWQAPEEFPTPRSSRRWNMSDASSDGHLLRYHLPSEPSTFNHLPSTTSWLAPPTRAAA